MRYLVFLLLTGCVSSDPCIQVIADNTTRQCNAFEGLCVEQRMKICRIEAVEAPEPEPEMEYQIEEL